MSAIPYSAVPRMHHHVVDPPAFTWGHVPEHRILTCSSVRPHQRDRIEKCQSVVDRNREIGLSLLISSSYVKDSRV
jgi:hypothetical protein